jgi:hypothetical protein
VGKLEKRYAALFSDISPQIINEIVDTDDDLFIFTDGKVFEECKKNIEETFTLYLLEQPELKKTFSDYGFISEGEQCYLYENLVIPFTLEASTVINIEMALFQISEHLIATEKSNDRTIYYVDKKLRSLIDKYQNAYDVKIVFYS